MCVRVFVDAANDRLTSSWISVPMSDNTSSSQSARSDTHCISDDDDDDDDDELILQDL